MVFHALVRWLALAASLQGGEPLWDHLSRVTDLDAPWLLIVLDLDGDGHREIFIASADTCGNGGCGWTVYSETPVANRVRHVGATAFHPRGYRLAAERAALVSCWHRSAGECGLGEVRLEAGSLRHVDLGTCTLDDGESACESELRAMYRWQAENAPPVLRSGSQKDQHRAPLAWTRADGAPVDVAPLVPDLGRMRLVPAPSRAQDAVIDPGSPRP